MSRYRDGFKGGMEKYTLSFTSIYRGFLLVFIPLLAYMIGLFPLVLFLAKILGILDLSSMLHLMIFSGFLVIEFLLFIIFETFIPGIFIRLLRLKINEGEYELSINDWNFFKYSLYYLLYRPSLKLIGVIPLLPLRIRFLKLVGLKMGKSSVLAGTEIIHDPYMTEIGDQTLIGGWSQIAGHIAEKKLLVKKVKIGDNCLIGGKSVIMPGAIIEDEVTVALNSVVLKESHLLKGKIYGGTPAKEIRKKQG